MSTSSVRLHVFEAYAYEGFEYAQSFDSWKQVKDYVSKTSPKRDSYRVMAQIDGNLERVGYATVEKGNITWVIERRLFPLSVGRRNT